MLDIIKLTAIASTAVINLFLGLLVFSRNPKNPIHKTFFYVSASIGLWAACLLFYESPLVFTSLFWIKITYLVVSCSIVLLLAFSFIFPIAIISPLRVWAVLYSLVFIGATIWLLLFTKTWVVDVVVDPMKGLQTHLGSGYVVWTLMIWVEFVWALSNFIYNRRRADRIHRIQLQYLFYGFCLWGVFVTIADAVIPFFWNDTRYFSISPVTSLFFTYGVAYVIIKHRFLDIRLVVARSVAYSLLLLTISAIYAGGLFLFSSVFMTKQTDVQSLIASTFLALVIAFTFQPLLHFFEKITESVFHKDHYDTGELLYELSQTMASTIDLHKLTKLVLRTVCGRIHAGGATIIVMDKQNEYLIESNPPITPHLGLIGEELQVLKKQKRLLIFEEEEESPMKKILRKREISVFLPLQTKTDTVGYLLLGEKVSGDIYFQQDIRTLQTLAPELAVALQNAQRYEESKRFAQVLQDKVAKATEGLRAANSRLQVLDRLKDEFISIASHDLRTPATTVKNYIWLVLQNKQALPGEVVEQLERANAANERTIALTNDMLDVSRIEGGGLTITHERLDITAIVRDVVEDLQKKAQQKSVQLTTTVSGALFAKGDQQRLHQVLTNLLDNAVKFTPAGGAVTVGAQEQAQTIEVAVADTGVGIAPADMPKLFAKFGRLNNSLAGVSEIPGTGLGLYIAKKLVELMEGTITVSSEPGKGSTFSFTLPKG